MSNRTFQLALIVAAAMFTASALSGCTSASASPHTPTPISTASASTIDPHIALTCAVLGSMQTSIEDAGSLRSLGQIDDSGYAAVLGTVANTLNGLRRNPQAGMESEVWNIQEAVKTSPPTTPLATFDPHAPDFAAAMKQAAAVCEKNQTQIYIYAPPGQG